MKRNIQSRNEFRFILYILQTIVMLFLLRPMAPAQVWQPLGPDDSNWPFTGGINYLTATISNQGVPYVAYMDRGMGDKASCRKFQGGKWIDVGQRGFSAGTVSYTSIAINNNGVPYLVYQENNLKATVKKYTSGKWVNVGQPGFTESYALNTSIVIDGNGTPYVVYVDGYGPMAGAVSVKKFSSGQWTTVGQRQFSAGNAEAPSMAIDNSGIPYVVYQDRTNNFKTVVKKFTGGTWNEVGNTGCYGSKETKLAINRNGVPFIACYDETDGLIRVKKFYLGSWIEIGSNSLTSSVNGSVQLAINNSSVPYLSFVSSLPGSDFVKKFTGGNWVLVGQPNEAGNLIGFDNQDIPYVFSETVRKLSNGQWKDLGTRYGFTSGPAAYVSANTDSNGMPYVAYQDFLNYGKASVMKFENGNWLYAGSSGFSADSASFTDMAIKKSGVPIVVYKDNGLNGRATVQKFSNSSWRNVGLPGFSAGEAAYTSIATNNQGVPFVAYRDEANGGKVTVKKFTEGRWKNVGVPGFTATAAINTLIRMECGAIPWIVYGDPQSANVELRKFQQGRWLELPSPGRFSSGIDMAINEWGTPYLLYREQNGVRNLIVKSLIGDTWAYLGPPVESAANYEILDPQLLLNSGSDPYVLYIKSGPLNPESFVTQELKLKYFNGSDWVDIWPSGLGGIHVSSASFTFKPTGQLLVMYNQHQNRGMFARITETPYVIPESSARSNMLKANIGQEKIIQSLSLTIFPNPVGVNASAYLVLEKENRVTINLIEMNGHLVWTKEIFLPRGLTVIDLPVNQLSGGAYLLTAKTKDGLFTSARILK